ncbi:MAG: hypothetical protein LBI36_06265 [Oscillospiraceae bacterium]|nr:hypothetical protein [Oscillospiraceae bacterium]
MKRLTKFTALGVAAVVFFCSCGQNQSGENDDMPPPFGEQGGGDGLAMYYEPGVKKIEGISAEIADFVSVEAYDKWSFENLLTEESEPSLTGHANLYSLLKAFKPDENAVREMYKKQYETMSEWADVDASELWWFVLTDEDFDVIFTYDDAKVNERFASEYSVFYNGRLYSPAWVYTHSIEDYRAQGIPAELIEEKREMYDKIPFVREARDALDKKIAEYSG